MDINNSTKKSESKYHDISMWVCIVMLVWVISTLLLHVHKCESAKYQANILIAAKYDVEYDSFIDLDEKVNFYYYSNYDSYEVVIDKKKEILNEGEDRDIIKAIDKYLYVANMA